MGRTVPVCPKCGNADPKRRLHHQGQDGPPRPPHLCAECRKQFTVKVGTVFESSHVPLHKWFQAAHLLASSKKGFSAHTSSTALLGSDLQDGVVHGAPSPRGHALRRTGALRL